MLGPRGVLGAVIRAERMDTGQKNIHPIQRLRDVLTHVHTQSSLSTPCFVELQSKLTRMVVLHSAG